MRVWPPIAIPSPDTRARPRRLDWTYRIARIVLIFALAFVLDTTTGNRWTPIWGSAAILASALSAWPAIRSALLLALAYGGVWVGFNLVRAFADDTSWASTRLDLAHRVESSLAAGRLPTVWLQDALFHADHPRWYDDLATLIYLSYFLVPHIVAAILLVRDRPLLQRYVIVTAALFLVSSVCFVVAPMNPPWRASEAVRVVQHVLFQTPVGASLDGPRSAGGGYAFEPNPAASWPSVHFGVTAVLALLATSVSRRWSIAGAVYALLMGASLLYLGEHYLVDIVGGGLLAVGAWQASRLWVRRPRPTAARSDVPSQPPAHRDRARRPQSESVDGAPHTV